MCSSGGHGDGGQPSGHLPWPCCFYGSLFFDLSSLLGKAKEYFICVNKEDAFKEPNSGIFCTALSSQGAHVKVCQALYSGSLLQHAPASVLLPPPPLLYLSLWQPGNPPGLPDTHISGTLHLLRGARPQVPACPHSHHLGDYTFPLDGINSLPSPSSLCFLLQLIHLIFSVRYLVIVCPLPWKVSSMRIRRFAISLAPGT